MKELPKIIINDEEENNNKKTIEFEIKSDLVGGNESSTRLINPDERGKIKRVNDVVIDKKEIEKAPHPPELPIPRMPVKVKRPPELPIPQKLTLKMRLHLLKDETKENAEITSKELTKKMSRINYYFVSAFIFILIGLIVLGVGIYGKINIENKYSKYESLFNDNNYLELKDFCYARKYKECSKYNIYINGLEYMENKKYKDAKEEFNKVSDFKNANNYINYIEGLDYIQKLDIDLAYDSFSKANILNAKEYIKYIDLIKQINNNEDVNYDDLNNIESNIQLNYVSNYLDSMRLFKEKNYKRIIELLEEPAQIISPAKDILNETKYIYAKELQYNGYIGTAFKLLNEIKDYKDASSILDKPIYTVINNWYYLNDNGFSLKLSFYESSDTCFNEIKNGSLIGLPYDTDSAIYEYKLKNNAIYFKDQNGEYRVIYIVKGFSKDKLTILFGNQIIELKPRT